MALSRTVTDGRLGPSPRPLPLPPQPGVAFSREPRAGVAAGEAARAVEVWILLADFQELGRVLPLPARFCPQG